MAGALFPGLLGPAFDRLAPPLRPLHAGTGPLEVRGTVRVERPGGVPGRLAGLLAGLPGAGDALPIAIAFRPDGAGGEAWDRRIGRHRFRTRLSATRSGLLHERTALAGGVFAATVDADGALPLRPRGATLLGLPWPRALGVTATAREWAGAAPDGTPAIRFTVEIALPLIGPVLRYDGHLAAPPE